MEKKEKNKSKVASRFGSLGRLFGLKRFSKYVLNSMATRKIGH